MSYCHHLIRAWWRSWISYSNDQVCGLQDSHISGVFFLHSLQLFTYALYMHFFFTGIGPLVCQVYWKNVWRNLWPQKCRAMCNSLEKPPHFFIFCLHRVKQRTKDKRRSHRKTICSSSTFSESHFEVEKAEECQTIQEVDWKSVATGLRD